MTIEQKILKSLKIVSGMLTVLFVFWSYGGDPVAWAASVGMAVASLMLLFVPEEV